MTYCKECNGEIEYCDLGSKIHNETWIVKKDFYRCNRCGRIIEEVRKIPGVEYK